MPLFRLQRLTWRVVNERFQLKKGKTYHRIWTLPRWSMKLPVSQSKDKYKRPWWQSTWRTQRFQCWRWPANTRNGWCRSQSQTKGNWSTTIHGSRLEHGISADTVQWSRPLHATFFRFRQRTKSRSKASKSHQFCVAWYRFQNPMVGYPMFQGECRTVMMTACANWPLGVMALRYT